ncbi:MAG: hypothetical protein ABF780_05650 [Bifidobacterium aquikefiri]|uniref:Lipoprotein n=1 Tax=Bifidobacterium aquikefiri TaxID=1653207 RepID=A0A261G303_9BIFI|nr:hypothetical protein [Bifidobacterium aquikefiri]OZG65553.1 hypothetical protein BAQU_1736 [Bifidobacterium aquikefiri]
MHRRLTAALGAVLLLASLGACSNTQPETAPKTTQSNSQTATSTAIVTVEGSGVATDVTITVIDPNTGLKPSDAAAGLDAQSASPTDSTGKVGDSKTLTKSTENVVLPYTKELKVTTGQKVTVSAQNGTSDGPIKASITLNGKTVSNSATGANAAVTATSQEAE